MAVRTIETLYEQHRDSVLAVLSRRCGWLAEDEREATFHDAYAVMLEKERDGALEPEEMHPRQVRAYLIQTAINKALDEGKSAHRSRSQPLGDDALAVPDREPEPEERADARLEGARVREIVSELPPRRQAVVKLRFFFERTPEEIQGMLSISARAYRRDLERALRYVAQRYELVRAGTFCESRESLILEYIAGSADAKRAAEARNHLASCPGCARWAIDVREAARQVGAALPLPALAYEGSTGRIADAAATMRDGVSDLLATGKQHAAATASRLDPGAAGYATGARPGAVATVVAACIAAGGGATYCAVEGVPEPVRTALLGSSSKEAARPEPRPKAAVRAVRDRPPPLAQGTPEPAPTEPRGSAPREVAPSPEPSAEAAAEPAAEPADTQFAPEAAAQPAAPTAGGGSSAATPAPDPADTQFGP